MKDCSSFIKTFTDYCAWEFMSKSWNFADGLSSIRSWILLIVWTGHICAELNAYSFVCNASDGASFYKDSDHIKKMCVVYMYIHVQFIQFINLY